MGGLCTTTTLRSPSTTPHHHHLHPAPTTSLLSDARPSRSHRTTPHLAGKKKNKLRPLVSSLVLTTKVTAPRKERVFSCPDHLHHSEVDITARLQRLFVMDTNQPSACSDSLLRIFDDPNRVLIMSFGDFMQRVVFHLSNLADTERRKDKAIRSDLAVRYLVATKVLIDRLRALRGLMVTPLNVQRLIATGVLIAAKTLDDKQPSLRFFALLGGVSVPDMVIMESCFLAASNYNVQVDPKAFKRTYSALLDGVVAFSDDEGGMGSPQSWGDNDDILKYV
jgi:hypothetical protein